MLEEVGEDSDVDELVAHDITFHHTIAGIAGNEFLLSLLDVVASRTSRVGSGAASPKRVLSSEPWASTAASSVPSRCTIRDA